MSAEPSLSVTDVELGRALAFRRMKDFENALPIYEDLYASHPQNIEVLFGLGVCLVSLKRPQDALMPLEEAFSLEPKSLNIRLMLGQVNHGLKRYAVASEHFLAVLKDAPDNPDAIYMLARCYQQQEKFSQAIEYFKKATQLQPQRMDTWINLGLCLREENRNEEALEVGHQALLLDSNNPTALYTTASAMIALERAEEALPLARKALALKEDFYDCSFNLSWALLALGQWQEGWQRYEERYRTNKDLVEVQSVPRWKGEALKGRPLVLVSEQGFGDTIQFARFAVALAAKGEKVILKTEPRLIKLFSTLPHVQAVIPFKAPIPPDSVWAPLQSMAYLLGITPEKLPNVVPYLSAEEDRVFRIKTMLGEKPADHLRIGISWRGNPKGTIDRGRSFPPQLFSQIAALPHVTLIALQRGEGLNELKQVAFANKIIVPSSRFDAGPDGFLDSAAMMMSLDLIITCDTSLAHLAGALGRPTFVALKHGADWRWLLNRNDSPWYPSLRLFRQKKRGDWESVFKEMADALRKKQGS